MSLQILPAVSEGATATPNDKFSITEVDKRETAPNNRIHRDISLIDLVRIFMITAIKE